MAADPTRRVVLTVAVAGPLLLAGCKEVGALGPLPKPSPAVVTLDHAIAAEELMIARYQAAFAVLTSQGKVMLLLRTLLGQHQAHLDQLRRRLILPPRLVTASPAPTPPSPPMPTGRAQVLADLAAAERAASGRLMRQLLDMPPALAQLMASISASEAAHAVMLAQARRS